MIYNWLHTNFFKNRSQPHQKNQNKNLTLTHRFLTRYVLNGCAEFCQVSALTRFSKLPSSFGFSHMKLILEQANEKRNNTKYKSYYPRLLLADRHWQTEILIESLFWTFADNDTETNISKRLHIWRTPFHLGMALVKFGTMENVETKVESLLDTLQLEWSPELGEYVLLGVKCFRQYGFYEDSVVRTTRREEGFDVSVHLALTHLNCFFQGENGK